MSDLVSFNNKIGCWSLEFLLGNVNSVYLYTSNVSDENIFNDDSILISKNYPTLSNRLRSVCNNNFFRLNMFVDGISMGVSEGWNDDLVNLYNNVIMDYCISKDGVANSYLNGVIKYNSDLESSTNSLLGRVFGRDTNFGSNVVKAHPFHLVDVSPWPLMVGLGIFNMLFGLVLFFHFYESWIYFVSVGLLLLVYSLFSWWNDVLNEGLYLGHHTNIVRRGFRLGMFLFILSEVLFFFGFFWAFFTASLNPVPAIGCVWPPMSIIPFDPIGVPLFNTVVLLVSGVTVTLAHEYLVTSTVNSKVAFSKVRNYLFITILLGLLFTVFQGVEYKEAFFNISDGIYGSVFFLITGFHGVHVIVGTVFLLYNFFRVLKKHLSFEDSVGLELAIWYWHFVDIVWLFVYMFIYCNYIYDQDIVSVVVYS